MKVYRPIILNQIDTFGFWVALANLCVKGMQCDPCAVFDLLVNDLPRMWIERTDTITGFFGAMTLPCQGMLRAGLCPVFCDGRLSLEAKLILVKHNGSFRGLTRSV